MATADGMSQLVKKKKIFESKKVILSREVPLEEII